MKHHEGSNPLTMGYDAGNRITTSILGSSQFTTFTHDGNGNMTGERCDYLGVLTTYLYDSENRCLNELRSSGAHHTYTYAPDGLRRSAHHGGAANPVSFVWDGDDLLNEYRLGGVSCRYDVLEGEVLGERRDGSRYLYVPDPLGSINHLLDTSQNIAGTYVYWPYGEVQSHTGPDTPMQFVGGLGYYTGVVNREYVVARFYRPDLGRWQTRDPIGFAGGDWNVYGYASGSPVLRPDPSGLAAQITFDGCNASQQGIIQSAFDQLCRKADELDQHLGAKCCGGSVDPECFSALCTGGKPMKVRCGNDPIACARSSSRQPCAGRLGLWVYVCPAFWTRDCGPAHCELIHELIHRCGVTGHRGECFDLSGIFPSCGQLAH